MNAGAGRARATVVLGRRAASAAWPSEIHDGRRCRFDVPMSESLRVGGAARRRRHVRRDAEAMAISIAGCARGGRGAVASEWARLVRARSSPDEARSSRARSSKKAGGRSRRREKQGQRVRGVAGAAKPIDDGRGRNAIVVRARGDGERALARVRIPGDKAPGQRGSARPKLPITRAVTVYARASAWPEARSVRAGRVGS